MTREPQVAKNILNALEAAGFVLVERETITAMRERIAYLEGRVEGQQVARDDSSALQGGRG